MLIFTDDVKKSKNLFFLLKTMFYDKPDKHLITANVIGVHVCS